MADIKHWDAGICPSCGTLYAEIFTLCECELPHNTEGVEVERVRLVRDSQLEGAVDLIERAVYPITEALNNPAHSWHGSDEARKWLIDAARVRGQ